MILGATSLMSGSMGLMELKTASSHISLSGMFVSSEELTAAETLRATRGVRLWMYAGLHLTKRLSNNSVWRGD